MVSPPLLYKPTEQGGKKYNTFYSYPHPLTPKAQDREWGSKYLY